MTLGRCCALLIPVLAISPLFGKELVYLASGFQLEVQSHTQANQTLVLHTINGTLEVPVAAVARIESAADHPDQIKANKPSTSKNSVELLAEAATAQGLPPELVRSVAQVESGLRQD